MANIAFIFSVQLITRVQQCARLISACFFIAATSATSSAEQLIDHKPELPAAPFDYFSMPLPAHIKEDVRTDLVASSRDDPRLNWKTTLGRVLFYDRNLSTNSLISCASCHKQTNGFDDISSRSIGHKGKITARNSQGLTGARFRAGGFFWDERATTLQDQVLQPFTDEIEMGLEQGQLVERVAQQSFYGELFTNAFGSANVNERRIADALALFVMSVNSFTSKYDAGRAVADTQLTPFANFSNSENRGKFLFFSERSKGGSACASCHRGELFAVAPGGANNGLGEKSNDHGIGAQTGNAEQYGLFRPASLRNIALRAPYMHDGRFSSLEDVVEHYSSNIQPHPNLSDGMRDESGQPLRFNFTPQDKKALVDFLRTLNDGNLPGDKRFSNPFLKVN